jgi:hypothetical protein
MPEFLAETYTSREALSIAALRAGEFAQATIAAVRRQAAEVFGRQANRGRVGWVTDSPSQVRHAPVETVHTAGGIPPAGPEWGGH